jgi:16S rRNA (guanine(966)-N(2))-methyltransferase RsmD
MRGPGLRVIGGSLKGRRLAAPDWPGLRPTSDRLRETLFNILGQRIPGARVLDACAGTGAVGIEALSRGAAHVTFADNDPRAIALVERNLAHCLVRGGYAIIRLDLDRGVARPFDVLFDFIFLDPPYEMNPLGALTTLAPALTPDGVLVLEHMRQRGGPTEAGGLIRAREVTSGSSALSFYRWAERSPDPGSAAR